MLRFIDKFMSLVIMAWAVSLIIQGLKGATLIQHLNGKIRNIDFNENYDE
jgi:hypothetical protein